MSNFQKIKLLLIQFQVIEWMINLKDTKSIAEENRLENGRKISNYDKTVCVNVKSS